MTTSSPRSGRLRIALIGTLAIAALIAGIAWWTRPSEGDGLVVEVTVTDPAGEPVNGAQVARRFAPRWQPTDTQGQLRLTRVVLRSDERASPDAIARAIDVRAPYYANRPGRPPVVERGPNGEWRARFVLDPFGLLRVHILPTNLPAVRAWVIPPTTGALEAVDGVEVARVGQPASFRVFGRATSLELHLEGATGVAARRHVVAAPANGFLREVKLEVEKATPIVGRIVPPEGVSPPTLSGRVEVAAIDEAGDRNEHAPVRIGDDGTFHVPYAGAGRYLLRPLLGYLDVPARIVRGGDEVTFVDTSARPWLKLRLERASTASGPSPRVRLLRLPDGGPVRGLFGQTYAEGYWSIPLPGPGRFRVEVDLVGTKELPPATGEVDVEVDATPGPREIVITPQAAPSGTVRVSVARPEAAVGGADVNLLGLDRRATVLFGVGDEARFPFVPAGPVTVHVTFSGEGTATHFVRGELAVDGELVLEAPAVAGGSLAAVGSGPGLADDREARVIAWQAGDSPYGIAAGEVVLAREGNSARWRATEALRPGAYRGRVRTWGGDDLPAEEVTFEIRAGEETIIEFRVEGRR